MHLLLVGLEILERRLWQIQFDEEDIWVQESLSQGIFLLRVLYISLWQVHRFNVGWKITKESNMLDSRSVRPLLLSSLQPSMRLAVIQSFSLHIMLLCFSVTVVGYGGHWEAPRGRATSRRIETNGLNNSLVLLTSIHVCFSEFLLKRWLRWWDFLRQLQKSIKSRNSWIVCWFRRIE